MRQDNQNQYNVNTPDTYTTACNQLGTYKQSRTETTTKKQTEKKNHRIHNNIVYRDDHNDHDDNDDSIKPEGIWSPLNRSL